MYFLGSCILLCEWDEFCQLCVPVVDEEDEIISGCDIWKRTKYVDCDKFKRSARLKLLKVRLKNGIIPSYLIA